MRSLNLWRMDLVFLISGVALGFLRRGQTAGALLRQRSLRLLLPLAFGMAVLVPFQPYAQGVANGLVEPGFGQFLLRYFSGGPWPRGAFDGWQVGVTWNHLWYLPYLWTYTVVLLLMLPLMDSGIGRRVRGAFTSLRGAALLGVPVLPLLAYSLTLWAKFPPAHDLVHDGWLHPVYFTLFLYGFWIGVDDGFWAEADRLAPRALAVALALLALHIALRDTEVPRLVLRAVADCYMWATILAILGWAHRKLNRPWRWLPWASESVYPWYMLHQTLIIMLAVWLAPFALGPVVEPIVLLTGTVAGCWGITALVRRTAWLRPLFGLKPGASRYPSPATPAHRSARSA